MEEGIRRTLYITCISIIYIYRGQHVDHTDIFPNHSKDLYNSHLQLQMFDADRPAHFYHQALGAPSSRNLKMCWCQALELQYVSYPPRKWTSFPSRKGSFQKETLDFIFQPLIFRKYMLVFMRAFDTISILHLLLPIVWAVSINASQEKTAFETAIRPFAGRAGMGQRCAQRISFSCS